MKKTALIFGLLTMGLMATDFSSLTLDELLALRGTIAIEDQADYQAELVSRLDTLDTTTIASLLTTTMVTPQNANNQLNLVSFDADGDGLISEDEFDTAVAAKLDQNIDDGRLLLNVDNLIDFTTLDLNDDGLLDATELLQVNQGTAPVAPQQSRGRR